MRARSGVIAMSLFARLANFFRGLFSTGVSSLEASNPEAVYQAAIDERIKRHAELKKAVSGIVYLRNKISTELETKEKDLARVNTELPVAVQSGDDDVAIVLLQQKNELDAAVVDLRAQLEKVNKQAEDAKDSLVSFQGEIEKLRRERDEMLARKATAEARIKIQESLDGLSTDADIQALDGVREHIGKLQAQADVGAEIKENSLDARLAAVREKAKDATARSQLEELKRQMAAQSVGADGSKSI
jgi:phage shock protein A